MRDEYERLAHFYDRIHAELTEDIGFILQFASQQNGPILELGCGSGRLLIPLARAGYAVTGIDNSEAMLAQARQKIAAESADVQARMTLQRADMSQDKLPGDFAAAIVSYNTAMHLDEAALRQMLGRVRPALRHNGQLLLDLANPHLVETTPADRTVTLERILPPLAGEGQVLQFASSWLEPDRQELQITWWFDQQKELGIQRTVAQMTYYYYFLHQLTTLLAAHQFEIVDIVGSYSLEPFTEKSDRLIVIAGN